MDKKIYNFRNLYSLFVGLGSIAFCNYIFYFTKGWFFTIIFVAVAAFYVPIYYGVLLLIFKHDIENIRNSFGHVFGEKLILIGFSLTIVCMILSIFVRGLDP